MKSLLIASLVTLALAHSAFAKAYFQTETELVTQATAIAVIEIAEPKLTEQKGTDWTYRQTATAKVLNRIKGNLPDDITVFGDETFICAQCHLVAGRYLAFLRLDGELWVGVNWHLSLRPVKADLIEWYATPEQRFPMTFQPTDSVLKRVRHIIAAEPQTTKKPTSQITKAKD
jgi:hypothetical protein